MHGKSIAPFRESGSDEHCEFKSDPFKFNRKMNLNSSAIFYEKIKKERNKVDAPEPHRRGTQTAKLCVNRDSSTASLLENVFTWYSRSPISLLTNPVVLLQRSQNIPCNLTSDRSISAVNFKCRMRNKPAAMSSKNVTLSGAVAVLLWLCCAGFTLAGFSCVSGPCINGICIDNSNSTYSCYCEDGFTGYECQTNWDECWSSPCLNQATCVDGVAEFTCVCAPGFTGELCGAEINECLSNPCLNGGTCEDLLDRYQCSCVPGYTGVNCERDLSVCNSSVAGGDEPRCLNGGRCVDGPALEYTCVCTDGWAGARCATDVNECLQSPCEHGGTCLNTLGSFACACQHGFTGLLCETEVQFCDSTLCHNGGICIMESGNATCYCVPDFHGEVCQSQYNDCLPYAPRCMNGGTCIDGVDSFTCSCPSQNSGSLCECDAEGLNCLELPVWFQDRPYRPIATDLPSHMYGDTTIASSFVTLTETQTSEVRAEADFSTEAYKTTVHKPELSPTPTMLSDFPSVYTVFWTPEFPSSTSKKLESDDKTITTESADLRPTQITTLDQTTISVSTVRGFPTTPMMALGNFTQPSTDQKTPTEESIVATEETSESYTEQFDSTSATVESTEITTEADDYVTDIQDVFPTSTLRVPLEKEFTSTDETMTTAAVDFDGTTTPSPELETQLTVLTTADSPEPRASTFGSTMTDLDVMEGQTTLSIEDATLEPDSLFGTTTPLTLATESDGFTTFVPTEIQFPQTSDSSPAATELERELTSAEATTDGELVYFTTPYSGTTDISDFIGIDKSITVAGVVPTTSDAAVTEPTLVYQTQVPGLDHSPPETTTEEVDVASFLPDTLTSSTTSTPTPVETPSSTSRENLTAQVTKIPAEVPAFTASPTEDTTATDQPQPCVKNCLHGGTCRVINGFQTCQCPFNYTGAYCEAYQYITVPRFSGSSYLKMKPSGPLDFRSGVQVYIGFTTTAPNGLVLYSEAESHGSFLMLLMRNSHLTFVFSCGVQMVSFLQANDRIPPSVTLHISFKLWWTPYEARLPWGAGKCSASLQVNDSAPLYSEQESHSSHVVLDTLYLAGLPSHFSTKWVVKAGYQPRLEGCVHTLEIDGLELDMWRMGVEGQGVTECGESTLCPPNACLNGATCARAPSRWSCVCQEGFEGTFCERKTCRGSPCQRGTCIAPSDVRSVGEGELIVHIGGQHDHQIRELGGRRKREQPQPLQQGTALASERSQLVENVDQSLKNVESSKLRYYDRRRRNDLDSGNQDYGDDMKKTLSVNGNETYEDSSEEEESGEVKLVNKRRKASSLNNYDTYVDLDFFHAHGTNPEDDQEDSSEVWYQQQLYQEPPMKRSSATNTSLQEAKLCLCPKGYHGRFCEVADERRKKVQNKFTVPGKHPVWARYSGSITAGYSSFSAYRVPFDTRHSLYLRLHFRTWQPQQLGLLLLLGGASTAARKDFISLALVHGHVMLTWDVGGGPRRVVSPRPVDGSLHTHSVLVGRRGKEAWMAVDAQANVTGRAPGYLSSLDTDNIMFIGGHESWEFHKLPADLWRLEGFRGCVYDIRVSQLPHFHTPSKSQAPASKSLAKAGIGDKLERRWFKPQLVSSRNVAQCYEDACVDHQCKNGATCVDVGATYWCLCPVGYKGPLCSAPSHVCPGQSPEETFCSPGSSCVESELYKGEFECICPFGKTGRFCDIDVTQSATPKFRGRRSYLTVAPVGSLRRVCHASIAFKPTRESGLIFYASGPTTVLKGRERGRVKRSVVGDYMALAIDNGTLTLSYKLNQAGRSGVLQSGKKVPINKWSTVTFRRKGTQADLIYDGQILRSDLDFVEATQLEPLQEAGNFTGRNGATTGDISNGSRVRRAKRGQSIPDTYMDVGDEIFIGGVPEMTYIPDSVGPPPARQSYQGCIGEVIVNGALYELNHQGGPMGVVRGQGLSPCEDPVALVCGSSTCANGGNCRVVTRNSSLSEGEVSAASEATTATPQGLSNLSDSQSKAIVCDCPPSFGGSRCEIPVSCSTAPCLHGGTCVSVAATGRKKRDTIAATEGKVRDNTAQTGQKTFEEMDRTGWKKSGNIAATRQKIPEDIAATGRRKITVRQKLNSTKLSPEPTFGKTHFERLENTFQSLTELTNEAIPNGFFSSESGVSNSRQRRSYRRTPSKNVSFLETDVRGARSSSVGDLRYLCLCPPGRVGKHCEIKSGTQISARFGGRSYAVQSEGPANGPPDTRRDNVALNMSTSAAHGLLLWRGAVGGGRGQDWIAVGVFAGVVRVAWTLGGGRPSLLASEERVDDGMWHSVVVARDGPSLSLYVDGRTSNATGPASFTRRDGPATVHIGGLGDVAVATATEGLFLSSFVGCLGDVSLHAGAPKVRFDDVGEGRDLQNCVR